MEAKELVDISLAIVNHMKNKDCIRKAHNKIENTITVDEICKKFELSSYTWSKKVKPMIIKLGFDIAYSPKGHYLGMKGEWASNQYKTKRYIESRLSSFRSMFIQAGESKKLKEGEEWCRMSYGYSLLEAADFLDKVGMGLPSECHDYLIEASK